MFFCGLLNAEWLKERMIFVITLHNGNNKTLLIHMLDFFFTLYYESYASSHVKPSQGLS